MTSAQVKGIYSGEMDQLEEHPPKDLESFCIVIRVMVGPREAEGEESFDIKACTPKWLGEQVERAGFLFGRHYLFISRYDPDQIRKIITSSIESQSGEHWHEVAEKVSRIGHWEFEDYAHPSSIV